MKDDDDDDAFILKIVIIHLQFYFNNINICDKIKSIILSDNLIS